jgi:hypothetical protein
VKSIFASVLLGAVCRLCAATDSGLPFEVERLPFGSGTPAVAATAGAEPASHVADGLYHVPNYLPGFPTAATLWPREVPTACEMAGGRTVCTGYGVHLATGRGEYIFVRPVVKAPPVQAVAPEPLPQTRKKPLG